MLAVIERLGSLQFDPLEVPGARNHDLVLHARIAGYRREWCERWLYGPQRRLIELYNKGLNIVPLAELPHYRVTWDRNAGAMDDGILREQAAVAAAIVEGIGREGPLSTAAFAEHDHAVDWWWAPTRAARAVAEALFVSGRLGIARREGNRRYYELIERLVPPDLLERREPEDDAMRHRLLSRFRATGLTAPSAQAEVMFGAGPVAERVRRTGELVERGLLLSVQVEGLKGLRYLVADEVAVLDRARAWDGRSDAGVAFIAPLDPLLWDRRLLRELWDFDYLWEVYVPEAKRRWGYYVLPILWGDRLVGRIEPRVERAGATGAGGRVPRAGARAGTRAGARPVPPKLLIRNVWWEEGFAPEDPRFCEAFRDALEAYRTFLGASTIGWSHRPPVQALRRALLSA